MENTEENTPNSDEELGLNRLSKKGLRREKAKLKKLKHEGKIEKINTGIEAEEEQKQETMSANASTAHSSNKNFFRRLYEDNYKKLLWFTVILTILAMLQIGIQIATTGDFVNKGVSLKGGITITVPHSIQNTDDLKEIILKEFPKIDLEIRSITQSGAKSGLIIEADIVKTEDIAKFVEIIEKNFKVTKEEYSLEIVGSSLGESFFKEIILSLLLSFVFMAIVVLIYFRVPIPSFIIILCAASDIIMTLAVVNLLGVKLSTAGIAAFLMLIGYSVDSDILLTTRLLKRKNETEMETVYGAVKTGVTMTMTTLAAVTVGFFVASSDTLRQIFLILIIGLIFDNINTWIQNVVLLRWYLEKHPIKQKG